MKVSLVGWEKALSVWQRDQSRVSAPLTRRVRSLLVWAVAQDDWAQGLSMAKSDQANRGSVLLIRWVLGHQDRSLHQRRCGHDESERVRSYVSLLCTSTPLTASSPRHGECFVLSDGGEVD